MWKPCSIRITETLFSVLNFDHPSPPLKYRLKYWDLTVSRRISPQFLSDCGGGDIPTFWNWSFVSKFYQVGPWNFVYISDYSELKH